MTKQPRFFAAALDKVDGKQVPVYPARFPLWQSDFKIHTFQEEIEMIQGLNKSTGNNIGIYPEIKAPWLFRHEGKDISKAVLTVLKEYGLRLMKYQSSSLVSPLVAGSRSWRSPTPATSAPGSASTIPRGRRWGRWGG